MKSEVQNPPKNLLSHLCRAIKCQVSDNISYSGEFTVFVFLLTTEKEGYANLSAEKETSNHLSGLSGKAPLHNIDKYGKSTRITSHLTVHSRTKRSVPP